MYLLRVLKMRNFPTFGIGLLSIVGFVGAARAADLSAPELVPIVHSWTGCYIGGHVGGVVSQDRTTSELGNSTGFGSTGFEAGGQIGCDYQFAAGWVAGVEGRAGWTGLKNSHAASVINSGGTVIPSQFTFGNDLLASATARLGYSFADHWLFFVRGGAAWTREKADDSFTTEMIARPSIAVDPAATISRTGWTVGTGVDWAFAPHWSVALEYDYYDFGGNGMILNDTVHNVHVTINSLKDTIHAATAGVNYHF